MKTLFLLLFTIISSINAEAQIQPKSRILGGTMSLRFTDSEMDVFNRKTFSASVSPTYGKFISSKWMWEVNLSYNYYRFETEHPNIQQSDNSSSLSGVGAGFQLTRLFPITDRLHFTTSAFASVEFSQRKFSVDGGPHNFDTGYGFGIGVLPGFQYSLSPRWIILARYGALSYNYSISTELNSSSHNLQFRLTTDFGGIGFRYVIGVKSKDKKE